MVAALQCTEQQHYLKVTASFLSEISADRNFSRQGPIQTYESKTASLVFEAHTSNKSY